MKNYLSNPIKKCVLSSIVMLANTAFASTYSIGTVASSGGFSRIIALLQTWVDFMVGPYGKAVVVGSMIIGVTTWVVLPKEGILGYAIRAVVAGVVILNIATWMGMFS